MCKCHDATFCPDEICIGYEDDVPVFVRRDSDEGRAAAAYQAEQLERRERSELARLTSKYSGAALK